MTLEWALVLIIPTASMAVVLRALIPSRCRHLLQANIHEPTGRIFYACRCGERFEL